MQGARPIYIYRLAPCTENCSQRIYKTFSIKYLEHVHIFSTFEPKKRKSVFQAAVSTCTLKILCCGYNLATQKRRKFIKNYDTRRCKEYSFSSLSANKGVNQRVTRFAPFSTPKNLEIIKLHRPTLNPIGKIYSHLGTTICYWGSSIVILNTTPLLYSSYFYFFYGRFQLR